MAKHKFSNPRQSVQTMLPVLQAFTEHCERGENEALIILSQIYDQIEQVTGDISTRRTKELDDFNRNQVSTLEGFLLLYKYDGCPVRITDFSSLKSTLGSPLDLDDAQWDLGNNVEFVELLLPDGIICDLEIQTDDGKITGEYNLVKRNQEEPKADEPQKRVKRRLLTRLWSTIKGV